ncbi:STM4015 family protein [Micromonospora sp. DSM 115977]|uniref:STM4015 family protein n=1 Tax=Micromonospora reichwaldensis TaxID=3075516 RepID=A0ABU2WRT1_9ACTN|nr:STM4015 family protein [Micromonospora sp. DSM 115977]MDT0528086.1 STM4015 family protein [Micromonospora sp. DSM 115977]
MAFGSHARHFAGRPVVDVPADGPLPTVDGPVSWRIAHWHFDDETTENSLSAEFRDAFDRFVAQAGPSVESLVVGSWGYAAFHPAPIAQLCAAAARLPALRALFLGDITSEECEVSWMRVGDVSALLTAYPALEVLRVRGGENFAFSPVRHERLRELAVESGGLSRAFVGAVLDSDLPALADLELWLGTSDYGGDAQVADLAPLLAGERFPQLRRLGLCNSEIADDIARALASAPVVPRLQRLDLSMGTLGDEGATALLAGQPLTHLAELDLSHHYLAEETAASLVAALPGVAVDVSDPQEPEEYDGESYRYTAVSE